MVEIGKQLNDYFRQKGITQEELAARLGVSQSYVNALLNSRKSFGKRQAEKWRKEFGLSPTWLLTGRGNMIEPVIPQQNRNGDNISGGIVTVNKTERDYLEIIRKQAEQIDRLLHIIDNLSGPNNK